MSETESTSDVYELYRRGTALLESGDFAAAASPATTLSGFTSLPWR